MLGPGFTLLDLTGNTDLQQRFDAATKPRGIPLKILDLADAGLLETYGADAILVRPDNFIAWAGSTDDCDAVAIIDKAIGT